MSQNRIAASKPNSSIGCSVTSHASSGVRHISRNDGARAHRAVRRQVAPRLAHHPDRRALHGLLGDRRAGTEDPSRDHREHRTRRGIRRRHASARGLSSPSVRVRACGERATPSRARSTRSARRRLPAVGLDGRSTSRATRYGIAHIQRRPPSPTPAFAQGYVMAHDRLPQMDILRRFGSGTLAELFGALDPIDDRHRSRDARAPHGAARAADWAMLQASTDPDDQQIVQLLQRFADGVNAYDADLDARQVDDRSRGRASLRSGALHRVVAGRLARARPLRGVRAVVDRRRSSSTPPSSTRACATPTIARRRDRPRAATRARASRATS